MKFNKTNAILEKELVSIVQNGCSLDCISKENRTRAVCLEAILKSPHSIKYVPVDAPFYTELAELASKLNGDVISHIDYNKYTDKIIGNAISKDVRNITYAINSNIIDHEQLHKIVYDAVTRDPGVFDYPSTVGCDSSIVDYTIVENALHHDGELLCRVSPDMRTKEVCKIALFGVNWYNIIPFIPKIFRAELVEELINHIRSVLEDEESDGDVYYNYYGEVKSLYDDHDTSAESDDDNDWF